MTELWIYMSEKKTLTRARGNDMKRIRIPSMSTAMCFATTATAAVLLCSCASLPHASRAHVAERYEVSSEALSLVEGKWRNMPKGLHNTDKHTLWERLTGKKAILDAVVYLDTSDKQMLMATLLIDNTKIDSRKIHYKQRTPWFKQHTSWFDLRTRHAASPFLW